MLLNLKCVHLERMLARSLSLYVEEATPILSFLETLNLTYTRVCDCVTVSVSINPNPNPKAKDGFQS